jgi:hypothetical protein
MTRVNPNILLWARETAGLSLEEASRKLGFINDSPEKRRGGKRSRLPESLI